MKDNNGRGIFYGVIGVATLVVAIIGATFAFFSAQVTAENAITNIASATVDLDFDTVASNFKQNLIPVNSTTTYDHDDNPGTPAVNAFARFPGFDSGNGAGTCKDLVGNDICSMYVFEVSNPGTSSQLVTGSITVSVNSGSGETATNKFKDLRYALFLGDGSKDEITSYDVTATTAVTENDEASNKKGKGNNVVLSGNGATQTLVDKGTLIWVDTFGDAVGDVSKWTTTEMMLGAKNSANDSVVYTLVVWLEDTGSEQDDQQGVSFAATVTFQSPNGGGVSGVITSAN